MLTMFHLYGCIFIALGLNNVGKKRRKKRKMNKNEEEQSDFAIWWIVHNQEKIIKEVQCCYVCDLPSVTDCMHLRNSGDGTRDWTRHHVKDKLLLKQKKKREREKQAMTTSAVSAPPLSIRENHTLPPTSIYNIWRSWNCARVSKTAEPPLLQK